MRRTTAIVADTVVVALSAVVLAIIITGGAVLEIGGQRVSVMGVDNPLLVLSLIAGLRYAALSRVPLFGNPRWPLSTLNSRASAALASLQNRIANISPRSCMTAVLSAAVGATLVKALLAWANPGFFSGDDVEVHEMSLGVLWNAAWPIWDLRNALFPMGVVYPFQKLFALGGVSDPATLVFAGRLAVALISSVTIVLLWRAGARLWPAAPGWGMVAALLFATTQLHIAFGSSELPRPVATVLVVGAFVLLLRVSTGRVLAAAVLLGIGASLRFSEAVFLVPAVATLAWERRWGAALAVATIAPATALAVVAATDAWYWGEPLHSLNAAVDYTLVHRLSSRGYQSPLWYLLNVFTWLSPAIAVLAAVAMVAARRLGDIWVWAPVLLLSALAHKEERYMIPVVPFACLAATRGLQLVVGRIADRGADRASWQPAAAIALVCVGLAHDAGHWRLPRSSADVALARQLDTLLPRTQPVAIQQAWRAGGRLYLHPREVVDLDPGRVSDPGYFWSIVPPGAAVVIDGRSAAGNSAAAMLQTRGYEKAAVSVNGSRYQLWTPPGGPTQVGGTNR